MLPDRIVSFLDGRSNRTPKRDLGTHGHPERFRLPADYPMVAPFYAAQRSALAKSIGLGQVTNRNADVQPKAKARKKAA